MVNQSTAIIPRITVTLMTTHKCNLNCVYCYEKHKTQDKVMDLNMMKSIVEHSFDKYKDLTREIVFDFMGGEPLLEFGKIKALAEWAWSKSWPLPYLFYATTNGTLLSDEKKEWFSRYKDRFVLGLSYDGAPEAQDVNRSMSSQNIDIAFFKNTWPFQSFKMTVSPQTLGRLSEGIKYLHSVGVDAIAANLAYGIEWNSDHMKEYNAQLKDLADYYIKNPDSKRVSLLDMNIMAIFMPKTQRKYCGAGYGMVFHDFDGKAYPCHLLSPVNLDLKSLESISDKDYCNGHDFAPDECKRCLLYNICPSCCGMNYLYLGSFDKRFPYMCKAVKIQLANNMRMQYEIIKKKEKFSEEDLYLLGAIKQLNKYKIIRSCVTTLT